MAQKEGVSDCNNVDEFAERGRVSPYKGRPMVFEDGIAKGGRLAWMRIHVRAEVNLYHTRQVLDKRVCETYEIGRNDF